MVDKTKLYNKGEYGAYVHTKAEFIHRFFQRGH